MRIKIYITVIFCLLINSGKANANNDAPLENTDYIQVILYGQSLSQGWECPRAITTTSVSGNYMVGNNVLMNYNNGAKILNPLIATKWANGGEQPIVSCVNAFSKMYRDSINPDQKFIGMTCGEGGKTIELLSKECTNATYSSGYYTSTFLKILDNTLAAVNGKTVSCPAIIYMQGEDNCNNSAWYTGKGLTTGSNGTIDKNVYKALLLKLKNNMQADIMQKYGQQQKPLFFIYQTSGVYVQERKMPVSMAQLEFAAENDDVVLLNPHYAMPDYAGGHLSTNGYRWYGELTSKTLYDVLVRKHSFKPVQPEKITINDRTITINYHVPVRPLVFDTKLTPQISNYGFNVYKDNNTVGLSRVQIVDDTTVVLTSYITLTGKIEVCYASNPLVASGNLRDSDTRTKSMYTYFDDSADSKKESYIPLDENGIRLYGKNYPLYNWSVGFYYFHDTNATGLKDIIQTVNTSIFPNPAKDLATLHYQLNGWRKAELEIYNSTGKVMLKKELVSTDNKVLVNCKQYPAGHYIYAILSEGKVIGKAKFLVK